MNEFGISNVEDTKSIASQADRICAPEDKRKTFQRAKNLRIILRDDSGRKKKSEDLCLPLDSSCQLIAV